MKLAAGTSIAQAITIALSPIITRLFTPEALGLSVLFISIGSILSIIITGQYELALVLPEDDESALNLFLLTLFLSFIVSLIAFLVIVIFHQFFLLLINNNDFSTWLYFAPLGAFLTSFYRILSNCSNRWKRYTQISQSTVLGSSIKSAGPIAVSSISSSGSILILGIILGDLMKSSLLLIQNRKFLNFKKLFEAYDKTKIKELAIRYKNFPSITVPHSFFNVFSSELVVFSITYFFTATAVGLYSLANRIILMPSSIISSAVGMPFYKELIAKKAEDNNKASAFVRGTSVNLLLIALLPFAVLFLFSPAVFEFAFGTEWRMAGIYCRYLVPFFYIRFVGSIISYTVLVYDKQATALIIEILQTFFRALGLIIGGLAGDIFLALTLFSVVSVLFSGYKLFWYQSITRNLNLSEAEL